MPYSTPKFDYHFFETPCIFHVRTIVCAITYHAIICMSILYIEYDTVVVMFEAIQNYVIVAVQNEVIIKLSIIIELRL